MPKKNDIPYCVNKLASRQQDSGYKLPFHRHLESISKVNTQKKSPCCCTICGLSFAHARFAESFLCLAKKKWGKIIADKKRKTQKNDDKKSAARGKIWVADYWKANNDLS